MIRSCSGAPGAECKDGYGWLPAEHSSSCSALCWASAGAGDPWKSQGSFLGLFCAHVAKFLVMERVWVDKQHGDVG